MGRQEKGNHPGWGSYCWVHDVTFGDEKDFHDHLRDVPHIPVEAEAPKKAGKDGKANN